MRRKRINYAYLGGRDWSESVKTGQYKDGYFVSATDSSRITNSDYIVHSNIESFSLAEQLAQSYAANLVTYAPLSREAHQARYIGYLPDLQWDKVCNAKKNEQGEYIFNSQKNYRYTLKMIKALDETKSFLIMPKSYFEPFGVVKEGQKLRTKRYCMIITKVFNTPDPVLGKFTAQEITSNEMDNIIESKKFVDPSIINVLSLEILEKGNDISIHPCPYVKLKIQMQSDLFDDNRGEIIIKLYYYPDVKRSLKKDSFKIKESIHEGVLDKWDLSPFYISDKVGKQVCELNEEVNIYLKHTF